MVQPVFLTVSRSQVSTTVPGLGDTGSMAWPISPGARPWTLTYLLAHGPTQDRDYCVGYGRAVLCGFSCVSGFTETSRNSSMSPMRDEAPS